MSMIQFSRHGTQNKHNESVAKLIATSATIESGATYESELSYDSSSSYDSSMAMDDPIFFGDEVKPTDEELESIQKKRRRSLSIFIPFIMVIIAVHLCRVIVKDFLKKNYARLAFRSDTPAQIDGVDGVDGVDASMHLRRELRIPSNKIASSVVELMRFEFETMHNECGHSKTAKQINEEIDEASIEAERISGLENDILVAETASHVKVTQCEEDKENISPAKKKIMLRFDGVGSDVRSERSMHHIAEYAKRGLHTIMMRPRLWDAGKGSKYKDDCPNSLTLKNDVYDFVQYLITREDFKNDPEIHIYGHSFGAHFATLAAYFLQQKGITVKTLGLETPFKDTIQASTDTSLLHPRVLRFLAMGAIKEMLPTNTLCSPAVVLNLLLEKRSDVSGPEKFITLYGSEHDTMVGNGGIKLANSLTTHGYEWMRHFVIADAQHSDQCMIDPGYYDRWHSSKTPRVPYEELNYPSE